VEAEAIGTRLSYEGGVITIERLSGISKSVFGAGATSIPVGQVNSVEWREPNWRGAGYIRFAVAGSQSAATPTPVNRDRNAVLFSKKQRKEFLALRDAIQTALVSR
jgi:hypothetical protein